MSFKYILDVGGSGISAFKDKQLIKYIPISDLYQDNSDQKTRLEALLSCFQKYNSFALANSSSLVLGLPGPVNDVRSTDIYCPPLGVQIPIHRLRQSGMVVVNDTICQLLLLELERLVENKYNLLVTVGTSLGACIFKPRYQKLFQDWVPESFEIAHNILSKEVLSLFPDKIRMNISPGFPAHQLFSVGGLAHTCGVHTSISPSGMRVVTKNRLSSAISSGMITSHNAAEWLRALSEYTHTSISEYGYARPVKTFIRGGLVEVLVRSGHSNILSEYFEISQ